MPVRRDLLYEIAIAPARAQITSVNDPASNHPSAGG
jgi:hypothetical protein